MTSCEMNYFILFDSFCQKLASVMKTGVKQCDDSTVQRE